MSTAAHLRPAPAMTRPPLPDIPPTRAQLALDALVTFWGCLEGMGHDEAQRFLQGAAAPFLLGLDVGAVLDALQRDRIRREVRRIEKADETGFRLRTTPIPPKRARAEKR